VICTLSAVLTREYIKLHNYTKGTKHIHSSLVGMTMCIGAIVFSYVHSNCKQLQRLEVGMHDFVEAYS